MTHPNCSEGMTTVAMVVTRHGVLPFLAPCSICADQVDERLQRAERMAEIAAVASGKPSWTGAWFAAGRQMRGAQ